MMLCWVLVGCGWGLQASAAELFTTHIPKGSTWRYYDSNPSLQVSNWNAVAFNDDGWSNGAAPLGYEQDAANPYAEFNTVISYGPDPNNKYVTSYYRREFVITNVSDLSGVTILLRRDDGAAVYINGHEVVRNNLPAGAIAYNTFASAKSGSADNFTYFEHQVDTSALTEGTNLVAVEVHQYDATSSDMRFDLSLVTAQPEPPWRMGAVLSTDSNLVLSWPSAMNRRYAVDLTTNLLDGFPLCEQTNITASPPLNTLTVRMDRALAFYRVRIEEPVWSERILDTNGAIDWTEYAYVASNYNQREILDYRFGPRYSHYHEAPETIPTVYSNSTSDGWHNGGWPRRPTSGEYVEWYSEGGQLALSPDAGAPTEWQPGVAQCWNGGLWGFKDPINPPYALLNHLTYDSVITMNGSRSLPDPGPGSPLWISTSGGAVPAPPVTVVRTHARAGVTGFIIYNNGLIGVCGTGNEYYHWGIAGYTPRTCLKLPTGKVPTAAVVTACNEFLLVTVWDVTHRKGQVAVIAIKGPVLATFDGMPHADRPCFWGIPNWPGVKAMKLLGFVDLPFAAPMAIKVAQDIVPSNGRGKFDNVGLDLNSQAERDVWYNQTGSAFKKTARCGYAVIASRAENKVAFLDLQPLFQYYRTMYFTTQANYDQTKVEGLADNQWPYTFAHAAAQTPVLYATLDVKQPTAVAAGMPGTKWIMRNSTVFAQNVYVASMDGQLRMYKVGDLMTTASGGSIGAPFNTIVVGKNPCSIDYGHGGNLGDNLYITCRGDNAVYYLKYDGAVLGVLRDSRITDVVSACASTVSRSFRGGDWGSNFLHLMDFNGRKVLNYRYEGTVNMPVGDPPCPPNTGTIFEFSDEQVVPGCPFVFVRAEVI